MDILRDVSRKKIIVIVFLIIIFQLILSTYFFACQKTGFFADDLYSYGYSNSPGTVSPLEKNNTVDSCTFKDSGILNDYLTVSVDERFTFGRIVETLKRDAHPPLFYFILHFLCSLTPGVFSKWSAFVINVLGFIILQVYLYRLSLLISKNRFVSILIMFFFGFTSATINMMVLLRMYVLATGFIVAFTFYSLRFVNEKTDRVLSSRNLILTFLFLYLASMTLYLSVLFAFFLTLYICIFLVLKRNIKKSLGYGLCTLISVGAMCASFPVLFDQLFSNQQAIRGADLYPFMLQFRTCIFVLSNGLFGINTSIFPTMIPFYFLTILIILIILFILIRFIFRNDQWFLNLTKKTKTWLKTIPKRYGTSLSFLFPFIVIPLLFLLIYSKKLKIFYYKEFGMRYFYILTPFITMVILIILLKLIHPPFIRFFLIIILSTTSLLFGSKCYLENELDNTRLAALTKGYDVIVIENDHATFMYHIIDLKDSNSFLFATVKDLSEGKVDEPLTKKAKESNGILLMIDQIAASMDSMTSKSYYYDGTEAITEGPDNDVFEYFKSIPGFEDAKYIDTYYGSFLYRLK